MASVAFSSQTVPTLSLDTLIRNRLSVSGVWFGGRCADTRTGAHFLDATMETLVEWRDESYCQPKVGAVFPLARIAEAVELCKTKGPLGKVIITCRDDPVIEATTAVKPK